MVEWVLHSLLGSGSDQIFGTPKKYAFSERFLPIDSHDLFKKIPTWRYYRVIFSKNWKTRIYTYFEQMLNYKCYVHKKFCQKNFQIFLHSDSGSFRAHFEQKKFWKKILPKNFMFLCHCHNMGFTRDLLYWLQFFEKITL